MFVSVGLLVSEFIHTLHCFRYQLVLYFRDWMIHSSLDGSLAPLVRLFRHQRLCLRVFAVGRMRTRSLPIIHKQGETAVLGEFHTDINKSHTDINLLIIFLISLIIGRVPVICFR